MTFTFQSSIARIILWISLILVLAMDVYAILLIVVNQPQLTIFMTSTMLIGIALRLAILFCLLISKGPIKGLIYTWGGLFAISGGAGLLSFVLTKQLEPVQAYFDKALYLIVGIILITIANKYIAVFQSQDNNQITLEN